MSGETTVTDSAEGGIRPKYRFETSAKKSSSV